MPDLGINAASGYGTDEEWAEAISFFKNNPTANIFQKDLSVEQKASGMERLLGSLTADQRKEYDKISASANDPLYRRRWVKMQPPKPDIESFKKQLVINETWSRFGWCRQFVKVGEEVLIQPHQSEKPQIGQGAFGEVLGLCKKNETEPSFVVKYQSRAKFEGSQEESAMQKMGVLQAKLDSKTWLKGPTIIGTVERFIPGYNAQCFRTGLKHIKEIKDAPFSKEQLVAFQKIAMDCYMQGFSTDDFEYCLKNVQTLDPLDPKTRTFYGAFNQHAASLSNNSEIKNMSDFLTIDRPGDFLQQIRDHTTYTKEERLQNIISISVSLAQLHSKGFCHNDIKEANAIGGRLIDFGECTSIDNSKILQRGKGTPGCIAPEVHLEHASTSLLSSASDIYSLALMACHAGLSDNPVVKQALLNQPEARPSIESFTKELQLALIEEQTLIAQKAMAEMPRLSESNISRASTPGPDSPNNESEAYESFKTYKQEMRQVIPVTQSSNSPQKKSENEEGSRPSA